MDFNGDAIGPERTSGTALLTNLRARRAAGNVTSLDGTWRAMSAGSVGSPSRWSFLSFGAVNHTCRVFLDGEELACHVGGFGGFAVEVTGKLSAGTHSLVVMVNNRREADRIPAMRTDWWNFGGITRSVELVTVPAAFMRDAWITMAPDGSIIGGASVGCDAIEGVTATVSCGDMTAGLDVTAERVTLFSADQASGTRGAGPKPSQRDSVVGGERDLAGRGSEPVHPHAA